MSAVVDRELTTAEVVAEFRRAIEAAGLPAPNEIVPDGKLRRFPTNGKRGDDAGWYVLFADGIPAGAFGCWRSGIHKAWHADTGRRLTRAEEAAQCARMEAIERERAAEEARRNEEARERASTIWAKATPARDDHPYLKRKGVSAHGVREHNGALVVPLLDADGELASLQFITEDGQKRFLGGGKVKGCRFNIGSVDGADAIVIAEGFSTAASIHEATNLPVVVAFSANNLAGVARDVRAKHAQVRIVIAGDNDACGAGQRAAREAAKECGGVAALPDKAGHDWNDVQRLSGPELVRKAIAAAVEQASAAPAAAQIDTQTLPPLPLHDALTRARCMLVGEAQGPEYPVEALGPVASACQAIANGGQMQREIAGQALLAVASLLVAGRFNVRGFDGVVKPLGLFCLTVAQSGSGKDVADAVATAAVREWQRQANREYVERMADFEAASSRKDAPQQERPIAPHRLCNDMTVEGLRRSFTHGVAVQGVFSTEGAAVLAGHGFAPEHRSKTAAVLCSLWDRGHMSVLRAGEGRVELYGLRLAAHLLIQPTAVAEAMHDPLLAEIGLWPRFFLAWPAENAPRRFAPWDPATEPTICAFWTRCTELLREPVPGDCTDLPVLQIDGGGMRVFARFFERMERAAATSLRDVRPFALRSTELALRVAAVLAAWRGAASICVDEAHCGVALAEYSLLQWQAALTHGRADPAAERALLLYRWLAQRPGGATFTEILRSGPRALRSRYARDDAIGRLGDAGLIEVRGDLVSPLGVANDGEAANLAKVAKTPYPCGFPAGERVANLANSPAGVRDSFDGFRRHSPNLRQAEMPYPCGFSPDSPLSPGQEGDSPPADNGDMDVEVF